MTGTEEPRKQKQLDGACGPQTQNKIAKHARKEQMRTKGKLGYRLWTSDANQGS